MEEIAKKIKNLGIELKKLKELLNIEGKRQTMRQLQLKMSQPSFWQNQKEASSVVEELKEAKMDVDAWDGLNDKHKEIKELFSLSDASLEKDLAKEAHNLEKECQKLRLKVLFSGKFDNSNAIVEINSGAGGTEACDWANMLFRMYFRWAQNNGFKIQVLVEVRGEEAGIKNITFFVKGKRVYGLLKSERGVHRLVRISPFDANKRRHTSFASVDVLPEIKDEVDIDIGAEDLKIDTFRASGAGGQHVNVTDSAVRITHLPSGIIVTSQNERSQYQNKQAALSVLKAKIYELREEEKRKELEKISGKKQKIEWGSQIRSYVLHPYLLVKDHRTNVENHDAWAVLDGKLDNFIHAYLKFIKSQELNV
ncbi:MAG: peptide chain release factor 2 [Candidatus Omnitrophota bacterium]|nr:MAG: peptide chain release factor 2 [Candidatus Omnitrophota bacterium]